MEQLVLLLVIAAIYFINWLLQKSRDYREAQREERIRREREARGEVTVEAAQPMEGVETSEEKDWSASDEELRRFFDALGLPAEEAPAEPVKQTARAGEQAAAAQTTPPPLPDEPKPVMRAPEPAQGGQAPAKTDAEMRRLARRLEQAGRATGPESAPIVVTDKYRDLLATAEGARKAMVLREVLGPPKGLQNLLSVS